jgi:hypothetical protein
MSALLEIHQVAEKAAIDFSQTLIRSGFVVNAGAIVAIPAIVALFNIDAGAIGSRLLVSGILFGVGIFSSWLAGIFAFFALAHKSDNFHTLAVKVARDLEGKYFPPQVSEMAKQAHDAEKRARRLRIIWVTERYIAIILSLASVALFLAGSWVGINAVLKAPHKLSATEHTTQILAPPCKDGSQSCQPWERDWSYTNLQPGAIVTKEGVAIAPQTTP